jgi:hypothetical protein
LYGWPIWAAPRTVAMTSEPGADLGIDLVGAL